MISTTYGSELRYRSKTAKNRTVFGGLGETGWQVYCEISNS
jgi:hypothetical protein